MSDSLQSHWLQHTRLPCPSLSPRVCSSSCPLSQWCYLTISSSVALVSFCLQSFPASGSFPTSFIMLKYTWHKIYCLNHFYGEGNGTPLQYSCLENPMDGGAWQAAVHGVAKSQTQLSDFTFTFHFSLFCIGEGNRNPLQCSCLKNPRDGGAWWAAVSGLAQSQTRLKWLSSNHFSVCGSMVRSISTSILLRNRHHHPPPESFPSCKLKLCTH